MRRGAPSSAAPRHLTAKEGTHFLDYCRIRIDDKISAEGRLSIDERGIRWIALRGSPEGLVSGKYFTGKAEVDLKHIVRGPATAPALGDPLWMTLDNSPHDLDYFADIPPQLRFTTAADQTVTLNFVWRDRRAAEDIVAMTKAANSLRSVAFAHETARWVTDAHFAHVDLGTIVTQPALEIPTATRDWTKRAVLAALLPELGEFGEMHLRNLALCVRTILRSEIMDAHGFNSGARGSQQGPLEVDLNEIERILHELNMEVMDSLLEFHMNATDGTMEKVHYTNHDKLSWSTTSMVFAHQDGKFRYDKGPRTMVWSLTSPAYDESEVFSATDE